jgi:hypothetical protein
MTFSVGSVLSRSWSIYLANLVPFFILALIVQVPSFLWTLLYKPDPLEPNMIMNLAGSVLPMVLGFILTGALTYGVFQQMRGRKASIGDCISVGIARLLPVIGVALVVGLGVFLGLLLLIVPGVILICMWWCAVPVAVVEKGGVSVSLARSSELTRGHRWTVFGIILVMGIIQAIAGAVIAMVFVSSTTATELAAGRISLVGMIVLFAVSAFFAAWQACANAVGYHDLRATKENIDIEAIAAVFD